MNDQPRRGRCGRHQEIRQSAALQHRDQHLRHPRRPRPKWSKRAPISSSIDAKTGEDITRSVLTQIIFEEESKGQNLLPIKFLRQLIRFYGDSMQAFVPGYLEMSLESLTRSRTSCASS